MSAGHSLDRTAFGRLVSGPRCSASDAPALVPGNPGYYAIYVDAVVDLPSPYCDLLLRRRTDLIYIGIATVSLRQRVVEQDLQHQSPSTFFRGIGSILGYRPPPGSLAGMRNQNNYEFSVADTGAIKGWIDTHLSVTWVEATPALKAIEAALIGEQLPILNTAHNPEHVSELAALRAECRRVAVGMSGPADRALDEP